ncbi:hypothetical protein ACFL3C_03220 [Patescibacteria group bacterium]
MKKGVSFLVALITCTIFASLLVPSALAVEFQADEEVFISEPILDDGYIAGGIITVDEDAVGDLYIAGGTITVNGNVEGDLVIAGGDITVNGDVGDDLRVAGGTISITGNVGDDVIATSGRLDVGSSTLIGGSLIVGNGYANIMGTINEDVLGGGGRITLGGVVYRDVILEVQETLMLTDTAKINGNLVYTSLREAELENDQVAGYIEFDKQVVEDKSVGKQVGDFFTKWHLIFLVLKYLSILLLTVIIVSLFPACLMQGSKIAMEHPWRSLGLGFVIAICAVAATIILLISVIGVPIAGIVVVILAITMYVAKVFAGTFIGRLLIKPKKMTKWKLFGITALGIFILLVIDIVPFIGWLASVVVLFIAFGALWTHKKELYDKLGLQKV